MASIWNDKTSLPDIGSVVVVKYAVGITPEYQMLDVKNNTVQLQILNDNDIIGWQYKSKFIESISQSKEILLSGYKEVVGNDWASLVDGFVPQEYDIYMLKQQINSRIQTLPNEVDGFDGIDYMNVIFGDTSVEQKAAVFVDVIQNIPAVKSVTFINASWIDKIAGTFEFRFDIQSIFGDLQFQIGLDAQNRKVLENNE